MANMARDRENAVEQDMAARLAGVLGALVRAGLLPYSAHAGKPVTIDGELEEQIEKWIREG